MITENQKKELLKHIQDKVYSRYSDWELYMKAWKEHNDNFRTEVWFDFDADDIVIIPGLSTGTYSKRNGVILFTIEQNTMANSTWKEEDVLWDYEIEELEKMREEDYVDLDDFCKMKGINLKRRIGEFEADFFKIDWDKVEYQLSEEGLTESEQVSVKRFIIDKLFEKCAKRK